MPFMSRIGCTAIMVNKFVLVGYYITKGVHSYNVL